MAGSATSAGSGSLSSDGITRSSSCSSPSANDGASARPGTPVISGAIGVPRGSATTRTDSEPSIQACGNGKSVKRSGATYATTTLLRGSRAPASDVERLAVLDVELEADREEPADFDFAGQFGLTDGLDLFIGRRLACNRRHQLELDGYLDN